MFTVSNVLINGNHTTVGQFIRIQGTVIHKDGFNKQTHIRIYCNGNLVGNRSIDTESSVDDKFYFIIPVDQLIMLKGVEDTLAFSIFLDHNEPVKPVWRTTVHMDDIRIAQLLNHNRNTQGFESLLKAVNTLQRVGVNLAVADLHKGERKVLVKEKFFGVEHELTIYKGDGTLHWVWKRDEEEQTIVDQPYTLMCAIGRHFHPCEPVTGKEAAAFASFIFHELHSHQDDAVRERFVNVCHRIALQHTSTQTFDNLYTRLTRESTAGRVKGPMGSPQGLYIMNLNAHSKRMEHRKLAEEHDAMMNL